VEVAVELDRADEDDLLNKEKSKTMKEIFQINLLICLPSFWFFPLRNFSFRIVEIRFALRRKNELIDI